MPGSRRVPNILLDPSVVSFRGSRVGSPQGEDTRTGSETGGLPRVTPTVDGKNSVPTEGEGKMWPRTNGP